MKELFNILANSSNGVNTEAGILFQLLREIWNKKRLNKKFALAYAKYYDNKKSMEMNAKTQSTLAKNLKDLQVSFLMFTYMLMVIFDFEITYELEVTRRGKVGKIKYAVPKNINMNGKDKFPILGNILMLIMKNETLGLSRTLIDSVDKSIKKELTIKAFMKLLREKVNVESLLLRVIIDEKIKNKIITTKHHIVLDFN